MAESRNEGVKPGGLNYSTGAHTGFTLIDVGKLKAKEASLLYNSFQKCWPFNVLKLHGVYVCKKNKQSIRTAHPSLRCALLSGKSVMKMLEKIAFDLL